MQKHHITLSEDDRRALTAMATITSFTVKKHRRIMFLLALDAGKTYESIMKQYDTNQPTLRRLVKAYHEVGLSCLDDKHRSGRPPGISGEQRAKVTALACSQAPEGHAKWTLRMLADKLVELDICQNISHTHVGNILKKTSCSPIANAHGALVR